MTKKCYLVCSEDPSKRIYLPDKEEIHIGRKKIFNLRDIRISRTQIICTANVAEGKLVVKTAGLNHSGCNGYALEKSKSYTLKSGDRLELILGDYAYDVLFENGTLDDKKAHHSNISSTQNNDETRDDIEQSRKRIKLHQMSTQEGNWELIDNNELLIYTTKNCISRELIASFDVDGTIIKTKSGARFPKHMDDWVFNFTCVPQKLKHLYEDGYKIVFFTNQSSLGRDASKIKDFKMKIENIVNKLDVPVQVFVAAKSKYRKPLPGMWNILSENKNDNVPINLDESFFVGDAAGREKNWAPKKNKDHSLCDRLFALNIGIQFYTPEEYFLKSPKIKHSMPEFDPKTLQMTDYPDFSSDELEVIVMVGAQGSGKSHFCKTKLVPKGYVYINRDELGSWQKCVKKLEDCLREKKSAVIDNTNPDKESRAKYIEVAKRYNVKCRCFLMLTTPKHCKHNNKFRELVDNSHAFISEILINSYYKNFQQPELSEGFSEIVNIPFVPDFSDEEQEKLYNLYLLES